MAPAQHQSQSLDVVREDAWWKGVRGSHRLMTLIILIWGVVSIFWGEKVRAGGGLGWDGVGYAQMVRSLNDMVAHGELGTYYAQRILPSAIVRGLLQLCGAPLSNENIIRCFEIYNLVLLLVGCWIWRRISDHFSFSLAIRWITFAGIFVNFGVSKQDFYYPVLTDVTALVFGLLLLLFFLEKRRIGLFLAAVLGALCWPTIAVSAAVLLAFLHLGAPAAAGPDAHDRPAAVARGKSWRRPALAVYLLIVIFSVAAYLALLPDVMGGRSCAGLAELVRGLADRVPSFAAASLRRWLAHGDPCATVRQFLTAVPALAGLIVALAMLVGWRFFKTAVIGLRRIPLSSALLAVGAIAVPYLMIAMISNPEIANPSGLFVLIKLTLFPAEGMPFLFLVSLAVFWGPSILLLVLCWRAFALEARELGPGFVAVLLLTLPLLLLGEPRFLTMAWPFFVLGLALALERHPLPASFKYVFGILTVLYAQFWLPINSFAGSGADGDNITQFPAQLYFMHYGLWMGRPAYVVQSICLLLSAACLYASLRRPRSPAGSAVSDGIAP